jgi:integrase
MANGQFALWLRRLTECLRLRVKDVDFAYRQITVRDGKGARDRVTVLPDVLVEPLEGHLVRVKSIHAQDLKLGFGTVKLPTALERKYPNAAREWVWQFVFPARNRSRDPRTGLTFRHHVGEWVLQAAVKDAVRKAGIQKPARLSYVFAIVLQPISLNQALTFEQCRSCLAIRT